MLAQWIISLNNRWVKRRNRIVSPGQILVLLPRCLHKDSCPRNVLRSLEECRRCGQCRIGDLAELKKEFGVVCCVVGGGRQAVRYTRNKAIKAIVAVACEKELLHGILAAFPKPVLAVPNLTPEGFCVNTSVDPQRVAAAIKTFLPPEA